MTGRQRRRPTQDVRIYKVQDRSSREEATRPFIARWKINGRPYSLAHETFDEADRYRSRLLIAKQEGEWFDPRTGEPESWAPAGEDIQVHEWARIWVAENWDEWAPRTRTNELDGLVRFLALVTDARAPKPPKGLRSHLRRTLPPDVDVDQDHECERWLARWVLTLGELTREKLADANRQLGKCDDGQPAKGETANRRRRTAKACIRRAVELERIPVDPWPPTPKGRSRRKVNRVDVAVDVKRLHAPETVVRVIDCLPNSQPGSRTYQAMTATIYYSGLRPSEVRRLRPEQLQLPEAGWGWVDVDHADDGTDEDALPKTGKRRVPIPPRLVEFLRNWIAGRAIEPGQLLFRTRCGNAPSESNWSRALQTAHAKAKVHHIAVYDYRHAAATHWLGWGMALAEVAKRLGDDIKTVVAYYINAMEGDEESGNAAVAKGLARTREEIITPDPS